MMKHAFSLMAAMAITALSAVASPACDNNCALQLLRSEADSARTAATYNLAKDVKQVVSVMYTGGSECIVRMYEKRCTGGSATWDMTLACKGFVGRNGVGKTREGDNKTPEGDWGIITAYGIKSNPGTQLKWVDVKESTYCCDDSVAYNRIIDVNEVKHACTGEHMSKYAPDYNYGFFIDYNKDCVIGKGSAIFFHCMGNKNYTAGCIAVEEKNMVQILRTLSPTARVIVYRP